MKNLHVNLHTLQIQLKDVHGLIKGVDRENVKISEELLINLVKPLFQDVLQMVKIVLDQIIYVQIYSRKHVQQIIKAILVYSINKLVTLTQNVKI